MHLFPSTIRFSLFGIWFYGLAVLLGLSLTLIACDSNEGGPPTGTLSVDVSTSGEMPDSDGYTLAAGKKSSDVAPNGSATLVEVVEGPHEVALSGLEANCSVDGANPRSTVILQGDTTTVSFRVTCQSTIGSIEIAAQTTGETLDTNGYLVSVDSTDSTRIEPNGRATLRGLSEGTHDVALADRQVNCSVIGNNPKTVSVEAGQTTIASFELTCPQALLNAIAFSSDRVGNNNIHAMGMDGTGPLQITTHTGHDESPSVSPNGSRLAFATTRDGNFEIYTVKPDGTDLQRVTDNATFDGSPTWSPDGAHIAFASNRDGNFEIYTMKPDGSDPARVTNNSAGDRSPAWSPDAGRIAFYTDRDGNWEIYTIKSDGTGLTRVTNNSADDFSPTWSPDGRRIALQTDRDGNNEVYTIKPDGSDATRITNNTAFDAHPDWSPAGARIAFETERDGNAEIYTIRPDGTGLHRVTSSSAINQDPSWAPSK